MSASASEAQPTLGEYARLLFAGWKTIASVTIVVTLGALIWSMTRATVYTATADALLMDVDRRQEDLEIARGGIVSETAGQDLGFEPDVTVELVGDSASVARFRARANTARKAARAADASATAYLAVWKEATIVPLNAQRDALSAQVDELAAELGSTPEDVVALTRLTALQAQLDRLDSKLTRVRADEPTIISRAEMPSGPSEPATTRNVLLGAALGIVLGIGAVLLHWYLARRVHAATALGASTGAPVLAVLTWPKGGPSGRVGEGIDAGLGGLPQLRAALQSRDVGRFMRSIQVTAPLRVEGLADLAFALGSAFVRAELSVAVVDADFAAASPALHSSSAGEGLTTWAVDELEARLAATPVVGGVRVVERGEVPDDPLAFVGSRRFAALISGLVERTDLVVVVSPPVLESPEALLIGRVADSSVLVVESDASKLDDVVRGIQTLRDVDAAVLGTVVVEKPRGRRGSKFWGRDVRTGAAISPATVAATDPESAATG